MTPSPSLPLKQPIPAAPLLQDLEVPLRSMIKSWCLDLIRLLMLCCYGSLLTERRSSAWMVYPNIFILQPETGLLDFPHLRVLDKVHLCSPHTYPHPLLCPPAAASNLPRLWESGLILFPCLLQPNIFCSEFCCDLYLCLDPGLMRSWLYQSLLLLAAILTRYTCMIFCFFLKCFLKCVNWLFPPGLGAQGLTM